MAIAASPRLGNPQIREFIEHDELKNSIYLFLRTKRGAKYSYLGKLKYLSHDTERENPVYFQWQVLEGSPPEDILDRIGLTLQPPTDETDELVPAARDRLEEAPPPPPRARLPAARRSMHRSVRITDTRRIRLMEPRYGG